MPIPQDFFLKCLSGSNLGKVTDFPDLIMPSWFSSFSVVECQGRLLPNIYLLKNNYHLPMPFDVTIKSEVEAASLYNQKIYQLYVIQKSWNMKVFNN
jgi:hypothetical protein